MRGRRSPCRSCWRVSPVCSRLCATRSSPSLVPVAGSAYSYAYATMGEGVAWLIGWCLLLEYLMSGSLVAIGWSGYATATLHRFGVDLPDAMTGAPLAVVARACGAQRQMVDLPAVLITLFTA